MSGRSARRSQRHPHVAEVYVGGRKDGWQDGFLKRADENPNRKGLEIVAQAFGLRIRPFADLVGAVEGGRVRGVWAVGSEVPDPKAAAAFGKLEAFVCQAYSSGGLADEATLLLPAAPHSEMDGTFVSFEGRAQRFELAYWPRGDSRPHWALAGHIARGLGLTWRWKDAREVLLYVREEYARLREGTQAFHEALFSSSLPQSVLEAVSANLGILKSPTILRHEGGDLWAWEGCFCAAGRGGAGPSRRDGAEPDRLPLLGNPGAAEHPRAQGRGPALRGFRARRPATAAAAAA